jgi:hypothetical protein
VFVTYLILQNFLECSKLYYNIKSQTFVPVKVTEPPSKEAKVAIDMPIMTPSEPLFREVLYICRDSPANMPD